PLYLVCVAVLRLCLLLPRCRRGGRPHGTAQGSHSVHLLVVLSRYLFPRSVGFEDRLACEAEGDDRGYRRDGGESGAEVIDDGCRGQDHSVTVSDRSYFL